VKIIRPFTTIRALVGGRKRPVRVLTVASQSSVTGRVAHGQTPFTIERTGIDWAEQTDMSGALLATAVGWWEADDYPSGPILANEGTGTGLDLRVGSTTGVDTNDPRFLDHDGQNYLWLPGTLNNRLWLRSPKTAATYTITYRDGSTASAAHTFDVDSRMFIQGAGEAVSVTVYDAVGEPIWTWVADEWESGDSITQLPARVVGSPNLMTNPSFEGSDVHAWSAAAFNAPTSFAISSERARTGTQSRKFVLPGNTNWEGAGIMNDMRGFEPNAAHTVTAWVYRESGAGPIGMTAGMENPPYTRVATTATAPAGEWEQLSLTATADGGGGLMLSFHNTVSGGAVTFFVDDIAITQSDPARTAEVSRTDINPTTLVTSPLFAFTVDDYLRAEGTALAMAADQDFTVIGALLYQPYYNLVGATSAHPNAGGFMLGMNYDGNGGPMRFRLQDADSNVVATGMGATPALGELVVIGGQVDRTAQEARAILNGVVNGTAASTASLGAIPAADGFAIGAAANGAALHSDFRWKATAVFDYILTQDEIDLITARWS
jgi:hypothetical protein